MPTAVTISSISPGQGRPAGGNMVVIQGTGFDADAQKMRVQIGGVESPRVRVRDGLTGPPATNDGGTVLDFLAPTFPILTPLVLPDANGEIVLAVDVFNDTTVDSATQASGYKYKRPDLSVKSHLQMIWETIIQRMQIDIIAEVSAVASLDWTRDKDVEAAKARAPAILLIGPNLVDPIDTAEDSWEQVKTQDLTAFTWEGQRATIRCGLEFDISIVTRGAQGGEAQAFSLIKEVMSWFRRAPILRVAEGATAPRNTRFSKYPMTQKVLFRKVEVSADLYVYNAVAQIEDVGIQVEDEIEFGTILQVAGKPKPRVTALP